MSLSRQPAHFRLDLLLLAVLSKQPGCGTWGWDGSRGLEDFFCAASDAEHLSERSELCEAADNRRAQKKSPNAAPIPTPCPTSWRPSNLTPTIPQTLIIKIWPRKVPHLPCKEMHLPAENVKIRRPYVKFGTLAPPTCGNHNCKKKRKLL